MNGKGELKQWAIERVKKLPDHIVAAAISLGLAVLVLGGGAGAVWSEPFRSALAAFVTARIYVWAVLVTVAAVGVILAVAWQRSRRKSPVRSYFDPGIDEIEHLGVVWPVEWVYSASGREPLPKIGMPRCPKDKTPLGWCVDEQTPRAIVGDMSDLLLRRPASGLILACFTCRERYRLQTSEKYRLSEVRAIVAERAKGNWATAHDRGRRSGFRRGAGP